MRFTLDAWNLPRLSLLLACLTYGILADVFYEVKSTIPFQINLVLRSKLKVLMLYNFSPSFYCSKLYLPLRLEVIS